MDFKGISKGFGFAQFPTTEHARAFLDPLFPFIQIPPPASHGASATAAFYKALETGLPNNGRRVKIDYSQSVNPSDRGRGNRGNLNDGTRDIGNTQGPVLLFRGLDPLSGPQAIYQAMLSSSGPGKPGAKGMKRIILIKDKVTLASLGFAFVEFVDAASASVVLGATMSAQIHPSGFCISDRPVAVSFAHPYSFQPIANLMIRDEACLPSSVGLGGEEGTLVRYWDEASTVAQLEFEVEQPSQSATTSQPKEKKEKRKAKETEYLLPSVPAAPSVLPVSDKPVTLSFSKGLGRAGPVAIKPVAFSLDDDTNADSTADEDGDKAKASTAKSVPLIANKKTAGNISKWNQVQEELSAPLPASASAPPKAARPPPAVPSSTAVAASEDDMEFSDLAALTCLLCARQLKTADQLKRHNKESELHKKNLQDATLRETARRKLAARQNQTEQPKYRDRASERRVLFNQPEHPVLEKDGDVGPKRTAEGPPRPPTPPAPPVNPGKDESNVGNKLLKLMGWTEGSGLGAAGGGRVDPISTAVYAQGAGLGASKGKDITQVSDAASNFSAFLKDAARERYNG